MNRSRLIVLAILAFCLLLSIPAFAGDGPHDLVLLRLDTPGAEAFLQSHRLDLDITRVKPGQYAEIAATGETMVLIQQSGLPFEVLLFRLLKV